MSYKVFYSKTAVKEIKSLPKQYAKKVYEKSEMLAENPRPSRAPQRYLRIKRIQSSDWINDGGAVLITWCGGE